MAMTDLAIWPRTKTLKYASKMFDELRLIFADIMKRKDVSQAIYDMAAIGKGRCITAKMTVCDGIDDAVTLAVAESETPAGPTGQDDVVKELVEAASEVLTWVDNRGFAGPRAARLRAALARTGVTLNG